MPQKPRRSAKLFSDFNNLQFASVMGMVLFVILLLLFLIEPPAHIKAVSADVPSVWHPVSMPGANRDDAILIWVTRDGKIFFGSDQITADSLADRIREHLKNRDVERKVYIKADMSARWGGMKEVLDGVRSAGIIRVAFLAEQRCVPLLRLSRRSGPVQVSLLRACVLPKARAFTSAGRGISRAAKCHPLRARSLAPPEERLRAG